MQRHLRISRLALAILCLAPLLRAQNVAMTPTAADFGNSQLGHWLVGRPFDAKFSHNGGAVCGATLQATFGSLPSNFQWTSNASSGELSGVFNTAGKYTFTLKVTCPTSLTTGSYTVYVNGPMSMVAGPYLPSCNVGVGCYAALTQGGTPNFSGQVVSGSLPPGCALWGAIYAVLVPSPAEFLNCIPTTEGLYSFQVSATDGLGETGTQSYELPIGPPGAFYTSTNILNFSGMAGASAQTQPLAVAASDLSKVNFTVTSDAAWLTATPTSGSTPSIVTVQGDLSKLAAGLSQGHLTLTPDGGKQPVTVTVYADLQAPKPIIASAPESAEVDLSPVPNSPRTYQLGFHAWNAGTGTLSASVSAISDLNWLSVQPGQVTLVPGQTQDLTVQIDGSKLVNGIYRGSVNLQSSTQLKTIPVTLLVPNAQYTPSLTVKAMGYGDWLLEDAYQFSGPPNYYDNGWRVQEIGIVNAVPQAAMDWTATLAGIANGAHLTATSGHVAAGQGGATIGLLYDIDTLAPGRHDGLLTVTAPGAIGSPASVRLTMNVVSRATHSPDIYVAPIEAEIDTPAIVFPKDTQSVTAQLKIDNPSNMPVSFTVTSPSSAVTLDPPSGSLAAGATTNVKVTVDTSKPVTEATFAQIMASVDRLVSGGSNSVSGPSIAAMTAAAYGFGGSPEVAHWKAPLAAGTCTPARLLLVPARPASYATWLADWPLTVAAALYDDCGNAVQDASVTASFSNGDAALSLPLQDAASGRYQATWIPGATVGGVTITFRATRGALTATPARVFGSVALDAGSPVISGISNSANPGTLAAPGGSITISGSNLAGGAVSIGGVEAAVSSANATQILARAPATLSPNARYEVVVWVNDRVSTPKPLLLGPPPQLPAASSAGPPSGSGSGGTFTFTFTDAAGWQSLTVLDVLISSALDGRQACYVAFVPSGANSGSVYLVDDAGDAGGPYSGMLLPGNGTVHNGQCSIDGSHSSVAGAPSGSGNTLTLTLAITFNSSFAGNKVIYLAAADSSANTGWKALGVWGVAPASASQIAAGAVTPARGAGSSQSLTFTFNDTRGYQDIGVVNVLINDFLDGRHGCYLAYSRPYNVLYLVNDAGTALSSGLTPGGSGSIANSQCTVNASGSSASGSGNTLSLVLNMSFASAFDGNRVIYTAARDTNEANNSGWQSMGTWTVQ